MWPFVRPKPAVVEEPAGTSQWQPSEPARRNRGASGDNVEVITTLSGEVHLRIAESGVTMGLKMSPNIARKLAGRLNAAADAVDPDEGEDDELEEPPSLGGIEAL